MNTGRKRKVIVIISLILVCLVLKIVNEYYGPIGYYLVVKEEYGEKSVSVKYKKAPFFSNNKMILEVRDDENRNRLKMPTILQNDGANVRKENVEIIWMDDEVEIILSGQEQKDVYYVFKFTTNDIMVI